MIEKPMDLVAISRLNKQNLSVVWLVSERSKQDTIRGNTIENGDIRYMFGHMYIILHFDPGVFVLAQWPAPPTLH